MAYRDDHEAALRRAEALAREVEELREKNAALEEERDAAEAARAREADERAAAAEPLRQLEELARRKPPPDPPPPSELAKPDRPPRPARRKRDPLTHAALGHAWWPVAASVLAGLGAMVGMVWLIGGPGIGLGVFVGFLPAVGALYLGQYLRAAQQRRWLARLPFDVSSYLGYLGQEHRADTIMTVTVEIAAEIPDVKARTVVVDAITGAMRGASASFYGNQLVIHSPPIHARFGRKRGSARTRPSNHLLHAWFCRLVRRALLPIARAYPIRRVGVG